MGCVSSKRDVNDRHPNIFHVVNIDDTGDELRPARLEITEDNIVLHQKGRTTVCWPIGCLKRYGYSHGVFSFELGRRSPTGAGIYAFKCERAQALIQLLQVCLKKPLCSSSSCVDGLSACCPVTASTMALAGSVAHISGDLTSNTAFTTDNEERVATVAPPIPAERHSLSTQRHNNYQNMNADALYVNLAPSGEPAVNYAVLDLRPSPVDEHIEDPTATTAAVAGDGRRGYATIDFDRTVALSLAVGGGDGGAI